MKRIGDVIEFGLANLAEKVTKHEIEISEETKTVILNLHEVVCRAHYTAINAVAGNDPETASKVVEMRYEVKQQVAAAEQHQANRLVANEPKRLQTYSVEIELIEKMKRIYDYASDMAKSVKRNEG